MKENAVSYLLSEFGTDWPVRRPTASNLTLSSDSLTGATPSSCEMALDHVILFFHMGAISSLAMRLGPDVLGVGFACPNI